MQDFCKQISQEGLGLANERGYFKREDTKNNYIFLLLRNENEVNLYIKYPNKIAHTYKLLCAKTFSMQKCTSKIYTHLNCAYKYVHT